MPNEETIESSVGGRIRARRKELRLEIESVSHSLHVPVRALEAIEEDEYEYFSAKVYALGVVRKLLVLLAIADAERVLKEFSTEWDVKNYHAKRELKPLPENRGDAPVLTPKRIGAIVAILFLITLSAFIGYRLFSFLKKPQFVLESPKTREIRVSDRLVAVRGFVERESNLTVNGREIIINGEGIFSGLVELRPGLNTLEFLATNRFGKVTKDVRYVNVE